MKPSAPAPDDLVEGLLSHFPANDARFTTDMERRHRAFYNLKEQNPPLFRKFIFDLDRGFPYCEDIEFAFSCLAGAALIRTQNVYLEKFMSTQELTNHFERVTKKRVHADDSLLNRLSKVLQEQLAVVQPDS